MENNMYTPENYFNLALVKKLMHEFNWPDKYNLEEDADGVSIIFPNSEIYIKEGYENDVSFVLLSYKGKDCYIDMYTALKMFVKDYENNPNIFDSLNLQNDNSVYASKEATEANVRDILKILNKFFKNFILGHEKDLNSL